MNAPFLGLLIAQQQAGAVVLNDFPQAGADRDEESVEVQMGDDGVIDLQQQL